VYPKFAILLKGTLPLIKCPPLATLTLPATGDENVTFILLLSTDTISCGTITLWLISQTFTNGYLVPRL
jgi:hypothetical protein